MSHHFPDKSAKIIVLYSIFGPRGTLNRIHYKPQHAGQNRPWVPHAGGQDDGSLHKLPQNIFVTAFKGNIGRNVGNSP